MLNLLQTPALICYHDPMPGIDPMLGNGLVDFAAGSELTGESEQILGNPMLGTGLPLDSHAVSAISA